MEILKKAQENMLLKEKQLSEYACKSSEGIWLYEDKPDIRPIFFRDIDRIIHSSAYTRYIDKTQVYSFIQNDHITHRVLHVQLVSKIARTIGRSLKLNEDLIEAIALGHDVGHTPFGHKGEVLLNNICNKENIGCFCHNAQSVRVLKYLEQINISLQTLDGILAHNGEILKNQYEFNKNKTKERFLEELSNIFTINGYSKEIIPMTLEACVVRLSDIIAYIGRDIEDAIIVNVIKRTDVPKKITKVLGDNNSKIVDTLIKDIIINSFDKPILKFSDEVFCALMNLKEWNYKNIYHSQIAEKNHKLVEELFNKLYYFYLEELTEKNVDINENEALHNFIQGLSLDTLKNTCEKRIIADYISGQTDKFFLNECQKYVKKFDINKLYK